MTNMKLPTPTMKNIFSLLLIVLLAAACGGNSAETADATNEDGRRNIPDYETVPSNEGEKDCVDRIFAEDTKLGETRNHACETASLSEAIQAYVEGLEALDYSGCPREFKTAFDGHIAAWRNMGTFTDQFPDLRGEMHSLFSQLEKGDKAEEFKPLLTNIWDTWRPIQKAKDAN